MNETLQAEVLDRLVSDTEPPEDVKDTVIAAITGEVEAYLGGKPVTRPAGETEPLKQPVRAYLDAITVEGFRGIGPRVELQLNPGPGLTLVVGRNGSGKSSFAEALELLLTGDNQRWRSTRSKIWKEGWRNLHHPAEAQIEARLLIDGKKGAHTALRRWGEGEGLESGESTVCHNGETTPISELGWEQPLATCRPFLSYNELGSLLEEGPSKLFDALALILGLDELVSAADDLKDARASRNKSHKQVKDQLKELRIALESLEDERAAKCLAAVTGTKWDLPLVESLVAGRLDAGEDTKGDVLRALSQLPGPDPDLITKTSGALRQALVARQEVAGTDADRARRQAAILDQALELHSHHGDADCPVCGGAGALGSAWRDEAEKEASTLKAEAETAKRAHEAATKAERDVRALVMPPPDVLSKAREFDIDTELAEDAWTTWCEAAGETAETLADFIVTHSPPLNLAIDDLRERARETLKTREDLWQPMALSLAEWLPGANRQQQEVETLKNLKSAEDWLRNTGTEIRNERFEPIKSKVKEIWALLRTSSNVDLEDITFEGKATSRRVNLDVTVDGTEGAALGVMSQGELHSLALALFLPRATIDSSPFRFLVIDDPVQSMDPARVDGLARVLDEVGHDRQVVVFTHDDRLPEAVRRLQIPARVIEVIRRENSIVELRKVMSPSRQYLEDAFALAKTEDLPDIARSRVIPNLCRLSLEAACLDALRRRRLQNGDLHDSVEQLFNDTVKLLPRLALAFFDDADKAGDVYARLNRIGKWQVDAVKTCNTGSHKGLERADASSLVRNVEQLVAEISSLS